MDYQQAVASLDRLAQFGWKLDLARIERLCELTGHPERAFPSVLVGGTNGKGSTCAGLDAILRAAGLRTGISPKPHLHSFRERIVVDGAPIAESDFAALMAEIQPLLAQVEAEEGAPTVFEALTLLALLHFSRCNLDCAVIEVGLGGRFDATNVLTPRLCVITNISLDHTAILGETEPEIATEKAGILKPGGCLVTGATGPALEVIRRRAEELAVPVWRLGEEIRVTGVHADRSGCRFSIRTPSASLDRLNLGLLGAHQVQNAALAVAAACWMREDGVDIPDNAIRAGLASVQVPARLQVLQESPTVVVDSAHNVAGANALATALRELFLTDATARLWLVLGLTEGHDAEGITGVLAPLAERVFTAAANHPRALSPQATAALVVSAGGQATALPSVRKAYEAALAQAGDRDVLCVTGSLFVAAEALRTAGARDQGTDG